jgi:putative transposase
MQESPDGGTQSGGPHDGQEATEFQCGIQSEGSLSGGPRRLTTAELSSKFGVHSNRVTAWKKQLLSGSPELFADGRSRKELSSADEEELYEQIGRLKMEVEWLKKNLPSSTEELRQCIDPNHHELSIARQCELVGLARSSWYYPVRGETAENLALMRAIDEQYLKTPFYGSRKMAKIFCCNRKRIQRLMRLMGIEAIYPKRRTTWPAATTRSIPICCGSCRLCPKSKSHPSMPLAAPNNQLTKQQVK